MRLTRRGLIAFAGLGLLLAGALLVNHLIETAKTRDFYAGRKILNAMYQAALDAAARHRAGHGAARDALMALLPAGTPKAQAASALSAESVVCADVRGGRHNLVCGVLKPHVNAFNWHIELRFDRDDRLADARVLILK